MPSNIACLLLSNKFKIATVTLAKLLNLPILYESPQKQINFLLYFTQDGLFLKQIEYETSKTIHVDFETGKINYRRPMRGPGRREIGHGVLAEEEIKRSRKLLD